MSTPPRASGPAAWCPSCRRAQRALAKDCVAALHQADPNLTIADTRSFKSDSLWSYELGTKTAWLDHRLTFDAAAFYIKWNNIQQEILLSCGFQFIANAGGAESKGGEMELHARPTEPLEVSVGVGYQNAKITEASASSPQPVGSPVYQVPDWTGNASVSYTTQLTRRAGRWSAAPTTPTSAEASAATTIRAILGNARPTGSSTLASPSSTGPFEMALVGKNLANEVANLGDNRSIAAEVPGRPRLFVNQPRTIGVEFRQSF